MVSTLAKYGLLPDSIPGAAIGNRAGLVGRKMITGPRFRNYEAGEDSHRRQSKVSTLQHEDEHLKRSKRKKLVGSTREAMRNFIRVGSAVRKHLDFVAAHEVDFDTGDEGLDLALEEFVELRSQPANFDAAGRFGRRKWVRLAEARRAIDGDLYGLKLLRGALQAIEGDRVRDPDRTADALPRNQRTEWYQGVRTNKAGKAVEYAIAKRLKGAGFKHERIVDASRIIPHVWHDTHLRFDSIRGVSPFAPGLNDFVDEHETLTHAQAKVKLAQIFGLKVFSEAVDGLGGDADEEDPDEDTERDEKYEVDLGRGPFKVELDPGENIDIIEGKTGAVEVIALLKFLADLTIQVLDLPPHFFDTSRVNFHGGKVGTTLYLLSAAHKRADVQAFLSNWLDWQLRRGVLTGEIDLPQSVTLDRVLKSYAWIPTGLPWFDRGREVRPTLQAIAGGVDLRSRVINEQYGMSLRRFLRRARRDEDLVEASGVTFANFDKLIYLPDSQGAADPD